MAEAMESRVALPLGEAARRLGHYAWVESRLFEILGSWVPVVAELEAKLMLGSQGHHHAWHARLWGGRLPVLAHVDRDTLTVPANAGMTAFMHALAGPATTVEKLAGLYLVLMPHLEATYTAHLGLTAAITDGPTIRALRLVLADGTEDRQRGEMAVRSLLRTAEDASRAGAHRERLEGLLVAAGGVAGPAPAG